MALGEYAIHTRIQLTYGSLLTSPPLTENVGNIEADTIFLFLVTFFGSLLVCVTCF